MIRTNTGVSTKKGHVRMLGYHSVELFFITPPTVPENVAGAIRAEPYISSVVSYPQKPVIRSTQPDKWFINLNIVVTSIVPNTTPIRPHCCLKCGGTAYIKESTDGVLPTQK